MAYSKNSWSDGTTPVDAERLNHLEDGVKDASDTLGGMTTLKNISGTGIRIYYNDVLATIYLNLQTDFVKGSNGGVIVLPDGVKALTRNIYRVGTMLLSGWAASSIGWYFMLGTDGITETRCDEAVSNGVLVDSFAIMRDMIYIPE